MVNDSVIILEGNSQKKKDIGRKEIDSKIKCLEE